VNALYHEAARDLDDVRRTITASDDRTFEDEPERFIEFLKSEKPDELGRITTVDRFEKIYSDIAKLPDAERAARIAAYNTWAQAQKDGEIATSATGTRSTRTASRSSARR